MEDKKDQLGSQRDLIKELNQDDIIDQNSGFLARSIRSAIENVDDPEFKEKYGRYIPFFQTVANYMNRKRQYYRIREHLDYADLTEDIYRRPNKLFLAMNFFFLLGFIGTFKVFKRASLRLTSVLSLMVVKSQVLDFYAAEHHLRNIALNYDDVSAQEIRNLFYLPDDPDVPEMAEKCEEFKKFMEIKKLVKSKKNS